MRKNRKQSRSGIALTWLFVGTIVLMMCLISTRLVTSKLLVQRLGVENEWTDFVLFWSDLRRSPRKEQKEHKETETEYVDIDWATLYPFEGGEAAEQQESAWVTEKLRKKIFSMEDNIGKYATDLLFGYRQMTEAANRYESAIRWNYASCEEYNAVMELEDGYFAGVTKKKDVTECAESTITLANFCKSEGIDFLYVETPCKISKFEDTDISGSIDFSNQNADDFLAQLNDAGIETFDLRIPMRETGLPHHSFFYNTDHHWKAETGLWASKLLLEELSDRFGLQTDPELLNESNFDKVIYPDWFLGSQGKKVTLERTVPDDFTMIYPKFETRLHYAIPNLGIDETGDFSITYDMSQVDKIDYYGKSPYSTYNYADRPVIEIENEQKDKSGKTLIIHNSFSNCVIPFLALDIKNVDALDLRHFTGSVENYIKGHKPDVVIVIYHCGVEGQEIDWTSHTSVFDFR